VTTVSVRWAEATAPATAASMLSDGEAERWRALRRPDDQAMFLAAHVLARWTVSEHREVAVADVDLVQRCDRCAGPHGRPTSVVAGRAGPFISLSHAGGFVAAVAADRSVGVDLEPLAQDRLDITTVALSPDEQLQLATVAEAARGTALLRWWVRKEALLKATGEGLRMDPRHIQVTPPWEPPAIVGSSPAAWLRDLSLHPQLAATVAVLGADPPDVEISRWRW
jgi:4'-phosphopantetheinyl transferase